MMITHVLAVDEARDSGWSLWRAGAQPEPLAYGALVVEDFEARDAVVARALLLAGSARALLFAYEDHGKVPLAYQRKKRGTPQILGLGAALAYWRESLRRAGHPRALELGVESLVWRKRVLGHAYGAAVKDEACAWASARVGVRVTNHDIAEALALGGYAALEGVTVFLGKRELARAKERARRLKPLVKVAP